MNLSCWGIKIRHPLWLLRWQGLLHQLIFLRDQNCHPLWLMCDVIYDICALYYYILRPLLIPTRSNVGVAANVFKTGQSVGDIYIVLYSDISDISLKKKILFVTNTATQHRSNVAGYGDGECPELAFWGPNPAQARIFKASRKMFQSLGT